MILIIVRGTRSYDKLTKCLLFTAMTSTNPWMPQDAAGCWVVNGSKKLSPTNLRKACASRASRGPCSSPRAGQRGSWQPGLPANGCAVSCLPPDQRAVEGKMYNCDHHDKLTYRACCRIWAPIEAKGGRARRAVLQTSGHGRRVSLQCRALGQKWTTSATRRQG